MIGAGAIGCELLKNFAMGGFASFGEGCIYVTDPDVIENSNLNRQFLFREKHIRKPKAATAAAVAKQMNPAINVVARLDRVGPETAEVFHQQFFAKLDCVANALDNVQARLYVDGRCIESDTALIESGTLGPKGHVQVILPALTETYGSKRDPEEENDIPYCTLKMFPESALHCLEWARDKFEQYFVRKPQSIAQVLIALD
jgi:ubiquitin-activating enzyme E1-like protein 2